MKRSEALGHIWSLLYLKTDLEEEGLKLLAEEIMDEMEHFGMLPPETVRYTDQENGNTLCSPEFTWDEETDA